MSIIHTQRRLVLGALAVLAGCGTAVDDGNLGVTGSRPPPVSWEQFRARVYREPWPGGVYIVDGDIPLSDETELRAYYAAWSGGDALTVDQVFDTDNVYALDDRFALTYCISDDFGDQLSDVETAMSAATASWHDWIGVHYRYAADQDASCDETNTSVFFHVMPVPDDGLFARSFFPDDARAERSIGIRPAAFTTTAGGRDFEGILRHELGHTLGFRHEHIWLTPACTSETSDDARQVTDYDVDSVMHYPQCRPSGTGGYRQTDSDYRGAVELYGLSALLIDSSLASITLL